MQELESKRSVVRPTKLEQGILFIVAVFAFSADQLLKWWVEATMPLYTSIYPVPFLETYFGLTHITNTGAAFSLLQNAGGLFIIIAAVVCGFILYYAPQLPVGNRLMRVALGLQMGGALGNVFDRLRLGYVTDMLHLQIPEIGFDWPVSNLADVFIVTGVGLLIVKSLIRFRQSSSSDAIRVDTVYDPSSS